MNLVGIVAEYNPLHNGHIYQIKETVKDLNPDLLLVVMSGPFTQQGNISVMDKYTRAKIASLYGADIVIELPTVFATSSAEYFAKASVNILNSLNAKYISFGTEDGNVQNLVDFSKSILENKNKIDAKIKKYLKEGFSYTKSYILAIEEVLGLENTNIFKSNNILAIEYIKELLRLKSNITPYTVKRIYNDYADKSLANKGFSSATSIRKSIAETNNKEDIKKYVPQETYDNIDTINIPSYSQLYQIFRYTVITNKDNLQNIDEVSEGIENRIYQNVIKYTNYDDFVENTLTRRITLPKLKRIVIKTVLHITKKDFKNLNLQKDLYARVLYMNEKGKKNIGKIVKNSSIPVIVKVKDNEINKLTKNQQYMLKKDIEANNIWDILSCKSLNNDYYNKI